MVRTARWPISSKGMAMEDTAGLTKWQSMASSTPNGFYAFKFGPALGLTTLPPKLKLKTDVTATTEVGDTVSMKLDGTIEATFLDAVTSSSQVSASYDGTKELVEFSAKSKVKVPTSGDFMNGSSDLSVKIGPSQPGNFKFSGSMEAKLFKGIAQYNGTVEYSGDGKGKLAGSVKVKVVKKRSQEPDLAFVAFGYSAEARYVYNVSLDGKIDAAVNESDVEGSFKVEGKGSGVASAVLKDKKKKIKYGPLRAILSATVSGIGGTGPAEAKYSSGAGFSANGRASILANIDVPNLGNLNLNGYAEGNTADPANFSFSLNVSSSPRSHHEKDLRRIAALPRSTSLRS